MNKELNFTMLHGIVSKVKKNYIKIDYAHGSIKVDLSEVTINEVPIKQNYTVAIAGILCSGFFRHYIKASSVSIYDTKPHKAVMR